MNRIIRINRPDRLKARLATFDILVDNIILGKIKNNSSLEISIDEGSHYLGIAMGVYHYPAVKISPGIEGAIFSIEIKAKFPNNFREPILFPMLEKTGIIPAKELLNTQSIITNEKFKEFISFKNKVVDFMIKVFNGQGIIDRIQLTNNRNHNIYVVIHKDGISLEYEAENTKGITQWATGRVTEKIYYKQMGVELPSLLPEHWSESLFNEIRAGILSNNTEFTFDSMGGFCKNALHPLF